MIQSLLLLILLLLLRRPIYSTHSLTLGTNDRQTATAEADCWSLALSQGGIKRVESLAAAAVAAEKDIDIKRGGCAVEEQEGDSQ